MNKAKLEKSMYNIATRKKPLALTVVLIREQYCDFPQERGNPEPGVGLF